MFNTLANELENTKMLREDFINSFSHEFKTPIASINGLIDLLKKDNLSKVKREEYLEIIEQEMKRLLSMTTNILLLSKVENQKMLIDIEDINISEQIRRCILLLNKKCEKKNLNLDLDFDEYYIKGNIDFATDFIRKEMPKVMIHETEATYMIWLNFNGYGFTDEELNRKLVFEAGVGLNSGSLFGKEGECCMRMNLACPRSVVEKALLQMRDVFGGNEY